VVGPTTGLTTLAWCACCRIVTRGRGLWSSVWSGLAGGLTVMELVCVSSSGGLGRPVGVVRLQALDDRASLLRGGPR
jgi:hypothetical protein